MGSEIDCAAMTRIAALSECFPEVGSPVPDEGPDAARRDWWVALKFWFGCSFMRGRADAISVPFMQRALKVLAEVLGGGDRAEVLRVREAAEAGWLNWRKYSDTAEPVLSALAQGGVNNSADREMVAETLVFLCGLPDANVVAWAIQQIEQGRLGHAYHKLDDIRWVGHKIASMFLREIVNVYSLHTSRADVHYIYLFPLDRWVELVCTELGIFAQRDPEMQKVEAAVATCLHCKVAPICFNQGAWYLGHTRGEQGIHEFLKRCD